MVNFEFISYTQGIKVSLYILFIIKKVKKKKKKPEKKKKKKKKKTGEKKKKNLRSAELGRKKGLAKLFFENVVFRTLSGLQADKIVV